MAREARCESELAPGSLGIQIGGSRGARLSSRGSVDAREAGEPARVKDQVGVCSSH